MRWSGCYPRKLNPYDITASTETASSPKPNCWRRHRHCRQKGHCERASHAPETWEELADKTYTNQKYNHLMSCSYHTSSRNHLVDRKLLQAQLTPSRAQPSHCSLSSSSCETMFESGPSESSYSQPSCFPAHLVCQERNHLTTRFH
jgi:hypothetical protein